MCGLTRRWAAGQRHHARHRLGRDRWLAGLAGFVAQQPVRALLGKAPLRDVMRRLADTNLYLMTAGETVQNPLELLNLKECKALIQGLRSHFDWVILDSPPLLFAADGNLLATMCDGTILVVRIGTTTFDSVTRALQSLCENNVLGVVVNGARRGELYSKYTYYHNYYYAPETEEQAAVDVPEGEEVAVPAED